MRVGVIEDVESWELGRNLKLEERGRGGEQGGDGGGDGGREAVRHARWDVHKRRKGGTV